MVTALASIAAYVAGGVFIQAKGWALTPLPLTWWSVPITFVASLVIYDAWFYWGHRMMHSKLLYRFHAHHHRSLVPTPWSNNSDTQIGAFVEQSYFLFAPFLLGLVQVTCRRPPLRWHQHTSTGGITGAGSFTVQWSSG